MVLGVYGMGFPRGAVFSKEGNDSKLISRCPIFPFIKTNVRDHVLLKKSFERQNYRRRKQVSSPADSLPTGHNGRSLANSDP